MRVVPHVVVAQRKETGEVIGHKFTPHVESSHRGLYRTAIEDRADGGMGITRVDKQNDFSRELSDSIRVPRCSEDALDVMVRIK